MIRNLLVVSAAFSLALVILVISIFRLAEVKYVFSQSPSPAPTNAPKEIIVNYNLAYPGSILSDNILWPLKALRDRVWLALTINPSKKADLYLLLADKRLADSKILFEKGKADLGISVLTKAEKYLESADNEEKIAKKEGMNTNDFLQKYAMATLKHRQVLDQILVIAPEDAKPLIVKTENYSKNLYNEAKNGLLEAGLTAPQNPYGEN